MTADQIRQLPVIGLQTNLAGKPAKEAELAVAIQSNTLLREIAAQLATLNEKLSRMPEGSQEAPIFLREAK